jgi:hypothetical protein
MSGHNSIDSRITRRVSRREKNNTDYILVEFMQTIASIEKVESLMGKVDVSTDNDYVYFIKV